MQPILQGDCSTATQHVLCCLRVIQGVTIVIDMELELREQLLDSDHGLWIAWFVYELDDNPDNFERARNAVHWQIRDGLIEVLYKCGDAKRVLNEWEVISVLAEEDNWHKLDTESFYFLHLTNEGAKLI